MSNAVSTLPPYKEADLPTLTEPENGFTSAYLGLNAAVKVSGVSKPTFLKYVEKGRISPIVNEQGKKVYQVVDIQRVFPNGPKATSQDNEQIDSSLHIETEGLTAVQAALLKAENERLREKLEAEQEKGRLLVQIAEDAKQNAEDWKQQAERATLILTDQRAAPVPQPEPVTPSRQGFFSKIFGGSR